MNKHAFCIAVLATIFPALAAAQSPEFSPQVTLQPTRTEIAGRAIDILGIVTGMTPNEATSLLKANYPNGKLDTYTSRFQLQNRGVGFQTTSYVSGRNIMYWNNSEGNHDVQLLFTGQASGNQLIRVTRHDYYPMLQTAPSVAGLTASLFKKYGEHPSYETTYQTLHRWRWVFVGGKQIVCQLNPPCHSALELQAYELGPLPSSFRNHTGDFIIEADINTGQDVSLVGSLSVTIADFRKRDEAARIDSRSLSDELERRVQEKAKAPSPMTRL